MNSSAKISEVDRIVAAIDETRAAEHFRNPDRPNARFVKARRRQDPAIGRAKTRLRTAAYRNRLDQRCAPSTSTIAMALVVALVTSKRSEVTGENWDMIGRAMADLQSRGYDLHEVKDALLRFKRRVGAVDHTDQAGHNVVV